MKIHRHWARESARVETPERSFEIACYGGSPTRLDEARREAAAVAARTADAIRAGRPRGQYPYARGPLREELVEELVDGDRLQAAVTRNGYGSLVLNAAGALFADIDYAGSGVSLWERLRGLFTGRRADPDTAILERAHAVTERHPGMGLRLYRTAAGYRGLATHKVYEPDGAEAQALLEELGADRLYIRLCKGQQSFRARLTPKPWRCGSDAPPSRYPWDTPEQERRYRDWQADYERTIRGYSTCALIGTFGSGLVHPEVGRVLDLHDRIACHGDAPLA